LITLEGAIAEMIRLVRDEVPGLEPRYALLAGRWWGNTISAKLIYNAYMRQEVWLCRN
jgi:hypothetical protein